jgi:hypothetical protein
MTGAFIDLALGATVITLLSALLRPAVRKAWWVLNPCHAPLVIDGQWAKRRQLIVRVQTPKVARSWIEAPPRLNVNGLEGIAWLAKAGDSASHELLFGTIMASDAAYIEVSGGVQDLDGLQREILETIGGRPPV